ncbi:MAG: 6-carboxytetrahydropterin synthase [Thermotogota bacterium]|nr:6-carboxytetrahydropterin synthase [Thermotogota bacterium]
MYADRIELIFDAGHRLLKYKGKCESPHGHTFKAEIMLSSEKLDEMGFVADFIELRDKIGEWVDEHWDHAFLINNQDRELMSALNSLNEKKVFVFDNANPTAEVMAKYLYDQSRKLYGDMVLKVRIWESPNQYAEYSQAMVK